MAYSDIGDIASGDTVTEAYLDQIRANFLAGVPDIFTTKGDIAAATAADAAARVAVGANDSMLVADSSESAGLAWQIQPAARVYDSGDQSVSASSWTAVTFDSERFDTDSMHSTSSNTSRLTVPTDGDGIYLVGANLRLTTTGEIRVRLLKNGATVIGQVSHSIDSGSPPTNTDLQVQSLVSLSATDYIQVQAWTNGAETIKASAQISPEFWAIWQRRA
jgi:hypothetical protein